MEQGLEVERVGLNLIKPYYSAEMALDWNELKSAMAEMRWRKKLQYVIS